MTAPDPISSALHDAIDAHPLGGWGVKIEKAQTPKALNYLAWEIHASKLLRHVEGPVLDALIRQGQQLGYRYVRGRQGGWFVRERVVFTESLIKQAA